MDAFARVTGNHEVPPSCGCEVQGGMVHIVALVSTGLSRPWGRRIRAFGK